MADMSSVDELDLLVVEYAPEPAPPPLPSAVGAVGAAAPARPAAVELQQAEAGPSRPTSRSRSPLNARVAGQMPPTQQQQLAHLQSGAPATRAHSSLTPEPPLALVSRTALLYDDRMLLHREFYNEHPERPERIGETYRKLAERGFLKRLRRLPTREVTRDEVLLVHSLDPWEKVQGLYGTSLCARLPASAGSSRASRRSSRRASRRAP